MSTARQAMLAMRVNDVESVEQFITRCEQHGIHLVDLNEGRVVVDSASDAVVEAVADVLQSLPLYMYDDIEIILRDTAVVAAREVLAKLRETAQ